MADSDNHKVDRRRVLASALGAVAGAAALAMGTPAAVQAANGGPVTLGQDNDATATTTVNCTGAHAVMATTNSGDAFRGLSSGANASGVFGSGGEATGYGVFGYQQVNAGRAALGAPQAALWASQFGAPWALKVEGKVSLSRAGRATIKAGKKSVDVDLQSLGGLSGAPVVIGNLMNYRSGVWVVAVRPNVPSAGWLRITLNTAVKSDTLAAWLVLG
jgi:hypothetical protein